MNKFEKDLADQLASLPKEKQPQRDLWRGIELSLHEGNQPSVSSGAYKLRWLGAAASIAVVVLLGALFLNGEGTPSTPSVSLQALNGDALVHALSEQHQSQKLQLLSRFKGQPAMADNWQQQLEELDDAADAIKQALKDDPDNTALLGMLQHVYQQQLLLIERVHAPKWQQI